MGQESVPPGESTSDECWTITVTEPLPDCPSVQAGWERIATQTTWSQWRSESRMRGSNVTTTVVPPATEPLTTGDEYVVQVNRLLKIRCRVVESPYPATAGGKDGRTGQDSHDGLDGEMVFSATGVALAGIVRARFRFAVFRAADGTVMGRAQEKLVSIPLLSPSREILEAEHRHTLRELNASFRSPVPPASPS